MPNPDIITREKALKIIADTENQRQENYLNSLNYEIKEISKQIEEASSNGKREIYYVLNDKYYNDVYKQFKIRGFKIISTNVEIKYTRYGYYAGKETKPGIKITW